jgi:hypothetical protein
MKGGWIYHHRHELAFWIIFTMATVEIAMILIWITYLLIKRFRLIRKHRSDVEFRFFTQDQMVNGDELEDLLQKPGRVKGKIIYFYEIIKQNRKYVIMCIFSIPILIISIVSGIFQAVFISLYQWLVNFPLITLAKDFFHHFATRRHHHHHDFVDFLESKQFVYFFHISLGFALLFLAIWRWAWHSNLITDLKESDGWKQRFKKFATAMIRIPNRMSQFFSKTNGTIMFFGCIVAWVTVGEMARGNYEARWHHMTYGLLCLLTMSKSLTFMGLMLVFDSMGYWRSGYVTEFGIDDVILKAENQIFFTIFICVLVEYFTTRKFYKIEENIEEKYDSAISTYAMLGNVIDDIESGPYSTANRDIDADESARLIINSDEDDYAEPFVDEM